jgi:hypothetical protein
MTSPLDDALQTKEAFFGKLLGAAARGGRKAADPSFMKSIWGGLKGSGGKIGENVAMGAAGALGAAGVAGVGVGAQKLMGAASKRRQFTAMLEANPDLGAQQKSNPKFFNTAYDSMRSINPAYGKDPVVSGSLMRRMMESPETAGTILMSTMKPPQAQPSGFGIEGEFGPVRYRRNL